MVRDTNKNDLEYYTRGIISRITMKKYTMKKDKMKKDAIKIILDYDENCKIKIKEKTFGVLMPVESLDNDFFIENVKAVPLESKFIINDNVSKYWPLILLAFKKKKKVEITVSGDFAFEDERILEIKEISVEN